MILIKLYFINTIAEVPATVTVRRTISTVSKKSARHVRDKHKTKSSHRIYCFIGRITFSMHHNQHQHDLLISMLADLQNMLPLHL